MTMTTTTTTTARQTSTSNNRRKQKAAKLITSKYFPKVTNKKYHSDDSTTRTRSRRRLHISQTTSAKKEIEIGVTSCSSSSSSSSSNYFLRSPSSAYGSVLSLGPLVYTWIGGSRRGNNRSSTICNTREEIRSNCLRRRRQRQNSSSSSSSRSNNKERKVCTYCAPILSEDAFRHFKDCLIFQNEQYKDYTTHHDDDDDEGGDSSTPRYTKIAGNDDDDDDDDDDDQYKMTDVNIMFDTESSSSPSSSSSSSFLPCVELVGRWAEQHSVRHLCPNQCFLRAFAPSREWMVLRKKLEKYTPIGEILNDWMCRLVFDDETIETQTEEENYNSNDMVIPVNNIPPSSLSLSLSSSSRVQTAEDRKKHLKSYTNHITEFVSLKSDKTFSSFEKGRKLLFRKEAPQTCIDTIDNDNMIFATTNDNNKSTTTIVTDNRNFIASTTTSTTVVGRLTTAATATATATATTSPFGLLEELFSEHPWRLLISTILLNKTKRNQNIDRILFHLFQRWPTAESVVKDANNDEEAVRDYIFNQVRITGFGRNKSKAFVQLSRDYLLLITTSTKNQNNVNSFIPYDQYTSTSTSNATTTTATATSTAVSSIIRRREVEFTLTRKEVKNIFNCGDYAADAFQIFIRKDLGLPIISNDYILVAYVEWKRSLNI